MTQTSLTIRSLTLQLGNKRLCTDLDLDILPGQSWGLLGRNGAGKTTLLHSILGIHKPLQGSIQINNKDLGELGRRELASYVGMLFQEHGNTLPATVLETAMLGRHPHVQSLLGDNEDDIALARKSLAAFDLQGMADREVGSLSGGEKQRLALAMLITQQPGLYLLDEPSNHLDVAFQTRMLSILGTIAREESASLLMASHDINLAARFCDHIVLMLPGGEHLCGSSADILNEENLSAAYECKIRKIRDAELTLFYPQ